MKKKMNYLENDYDLECKDGFTEDDFREEQATRNVIIGVCIVFVIILTFLTIQYVYGTGN